MRPSSPLTPQINLYMLAVGRPVQRTYLHEGAQDISNAVFARGFFGPRETRNTIDALSNSIVSTSAVSAALATISRQIPFAICCIRVDNFDSYL